MPVDRNQSIEATVEKFIAVMKLCTDEQFSERIDIMNQLCEIWENGEDVDLRCNEPEMTPTTKVNQSNESAPVMPRRKPGEAAIPFDCLVCGKSFRFYSQLQQHSRHHAGVRPFECRTCGQSFALQCSLAKHVTVHSNEKPLMCDTCGQRFAHVNYLKSHQQTHLRKHPYSCQECNKRFTTSGSLRHHIAVTHSEMVVDSPEHQFTCDKCGKTFTSLVLVRQHLDSHSKVDGDRTANGRTETMAYHQTGSVTSSESQIFCGKVLKSEGEPSTLCGHTEDHSVVPDVVLSAETMALLGDVVTTVSTSVEHDSSDFSYGVLVKSENCV